MPICLRVLCCTLFALVLTAATAVADPAYRTLNDESPGTKVSIEKLLVPGKLNVIDFYSEYCPPCKAVAPYLKQLAEQDPKVVVGTLDINRPKVRGIDWNSPLAQQFKLRSIPHFKIYDADGKLVAEGAEAKKQVAELLRENQAQSR